MSYWTPITLSQCNHCYVPEPSQAPCPVPFPSHIRKTFALFSLAQHTESIHTLPSQQMTYRFPGYKNRQATHAHCRLSLTTGKSARCSCSDPSL